MATSQDRSSGMAKTFLQGKVKGARKTEERMENNIKEWMGIGFGDSLRVAEDREGWKGIVATLWFPDDLQG